MKRFADLTYKKQQKVVAFLFLLVPVALTIVFGYLPFVSMVEYSFMRWDGMGEKEFIGFKNYVDALTRPENYRVFKVALYYLVASVVQIALALFFATILSFNSSTEDKSVVIPSRYLFSMIPRKFIPLKSTI